jgi:hypothetical protein
MTFATKFSALAMIAVLATSAHAQFVKGNEAIATRNDGARMVETPPLPAATLGPACRADNPGCASRGWLMLETNDGLRECTEYYARPGTCRKSTFGTEKRPRLWIVKVKGEWMQCPTPEVASRCVSIKALPPLAAAQ